MIKLEPKENFQQKDDLINHLYNIIEKMLNEKKIPDNVESEIKAVS